MIPVIMMLFPISILSRVVFDNIPVDLHGLGGCDHHHAGNRQTQDTRTPQSGMAHDRTYVLTQKTSDAISYPNSDVHLAPPDFSIQYPQKDLLRRLALNWE